ncbi:MAG: tRNA guanosine(34) transglycosylase Tgt [Spirochaetia bacterium]|nr:tRNA guanosine(34) transglycosylase Tgt [Spirochaetia bacterium]
MKQPLTFNLEKKDNSARAGLLKFKSGLTVETPVFMPVGTQATVKSVTQEDLEEIGYKLILTNTYHLYLRPGLEIVESFKGIKNFMSWKHAMLTDSGGYQAFSLSDLIKYRQNGVEFKSHLDGSSHLFSPEKVLDIQNIIQSDIVMPIDDCAPYPADQKRLKESLDRTHRWIAESKKIWLEKNYNENQALFGIVQGGVDINFRKESSKFIAELDLPGSALGGLSVGEKNKDFLEAIAVCNEYLPAEKPRYLMGVGSIPEILNSVALGIDMMDCVLPTRNARNGQVFTSKGKLNLRNEKNKLLETPIDENCSCRVCKRYSLGYIRHLHKTKEILAYNLSTYHNLYFMKQFMENLRVSIISGKFEDYRKKWLEIFGSGS